MDDFLLNSEFISTRRSGVQVPRAESGNTKVLRDRGLPCDEAAAKGFNPLELIKGGYPPNAVIGSTATDLSRLCHSKITCVSAVRESMLESMPMPSGEISRDSRVLDVCVA